jgi:hypothetical protein
MDCGDLVLLASSQEDANKALAALCAEAGSRKVSCTVRIHPIVPPGTAYFADRKILDGLL